VSRTINDTAIHLTKQEKMQRDLSSGKLLFTEYQGRLCALYLKNDRLLAARVLPGTRNRVGGIYVGKIKNSVKNLKAYFVEIADKQICFLGEKDAQNPILLNRTYDGRLVEGDELLVQINKEAVKTKQPCVSTELSLSNDYFVITTGNNRIGYSTKLSGEKKAALKGWLERETPTNSNFGLILRTRAAECEKEELLASVSALSDEMHKLIQTASHKTCYSCVKEAPDFFEAVLEQLVFAGEYEEIVTDDTGLYEKLKNYCLKHLPQKKVRLYDDPQLALSKLYGIDHKMDMALNRRIWLKSGGYLIIEPTEALTVIDVNSGKYDENKTPEETFARINREAAEEIAIQLRLRNLSGMILVDFINMKSSRQEKELMAYLSDLLAHDRILARVVDITALGLIEITRKKQYKTLAEQFHDATFEEG